MGGRDEANDGRKKDNNKGICREVKKKHDTAKTPYQGVLESPYISEESKDKIRAQYVKLNPAELKRQITRLQNKLLRLTS